MTAFYDRVKSVAATCNTTGNVTWTTAATQFALPPSGVDETVCYTLLDANGVNWETGRSALTESGGTYTLARSGNQVVTSSSNAGSAASLSSSSVHTIFLTADALQTSFHYCLLKSANNTGLVQGVEFDVTWSTETADTLSFADLVADSSRITIPSDEGIEEVELSALVRVGDTENINGAYVRCSIRHYNSSDVLQASYNNYARSAADVHLAASTATGVISVDDGDYFIVNSVCDDLHSTGAKTAIGGFFQLKVVS